MISRTAALSTAHPSAGTRDEASGVVVKRDAEASELASRAERSIEEFMFMGWEKGFGPGAILV
jgi:hypothetical protein